MQSRSGTRAGVVAKQCPKSIITSDSLSLIDTYRVFKQFGTSNTSGLSARFADAFVILEGGIQKGGSIMSKTSSSLYNSLVKVLTHSGGTSLRQFSGSYFHSNQKSESTSGGGASLQAPKTADKTSISLSGKTYSEGIQFGSPSQKSVNSQKVNPASTSLQKLTSSFLSGGLASLAGGSLGSLGLGSLVNTVLGTIQQ